MNQFSVVGNVTADMDVRFTKSNKPYAYFTVAENMYNGKEKVAQFHKCVIYGKRAETLDEYVKKGDKISVSGSLRWEVFTNSEGKEVSFWRVIVKDFDFCESKGIRESRHAKQESTPRTETEEEIPF